MTNIRPLYVIIRNFCSFGNQPTRIDLPGPGETMLIQGPIGSGKSNIINALFWNVTGRKHKKGTIVNTVNQGEVMVESGWHIPGLSEPLVIKRGTKPAHLSVTGIPGTLQRGVQEVLDEKFGLTDPQVLGDPSHPKIPGFRMRLPKQTFLQLTRIGRDWHQKRRLFRISCDG